MGRPGRTGAAEDKNVMLVPGPGEVPTSLVRRLQERYGPRSEKSEEKKLSRKDLGLDEATFRRLDTNGDGVLDATELAGFVKRPPDLELVMRLGKKKASEAGVEIVRGSASPLTGKVTRTGGVALLDLGVTRIELRGGGNEEQGPDLIGGILRQQLLAQFKQA